MSTADDAGPPHPARRGAPSGTRAAARAADPPRKARKGGLSHLRSVAKRPPLLALLVLSTALFLILFSVARLNGTGCGGLGGSGGAGAMVSGLVGGTRQLTPTAATATAPENFDLIPALQAWRDPAYAQPRLSIYVYDLPTRFNEDLVLASHRAPARVRDPHCDTSFYSSEVHVHRFLRNSTLRTHDPEKASFFYVPIYTTCLLNMHQPNGMHHVARHFGDAMRIVTTNYPYWNRTNGRDHVFLFAQGFSARLSGNWYRIKNAIFMVHNGEFTAPEYTPHKDLTIPPDLRSYFRPVWLAYADGVGPVRKKYLGHFGGQVVDLRVSDHRGSNYSGGVRQFIRDELAENEDYKITGVRTDSYLEDMRKSKFCLAPEGWHPWSPRPYYSIMMGCIPVIVSEKQEMAFEDLVDWDSFVVWVRPADIFDLDAILRGISDAEITRRRLAMKAIWRAFWYGPDGLAFEAILRSLHSRKLASPPRRVFSSLVET